MNARQREILERIHAAGEVRVEELADDFSVSAMTIRRDLDYLAREGAVARTHGGAIVSRPGQVAFSFLERGAVLAAEKQAIAREVAQAIEPGMSISLDTGTTTLEVACAIQGVKDLRVLTSSLVIAAALFGRANIELVLLGGVARTGSPDLTGMLTEDNLKQYRVDLAVLGADGADEAGLYTTDSAVARVSRAMLSSAQEAVVVADHSKFKQPAFVRFAGWDHIDWLVSDAGLDTQARAWLSRHQVRHTLARVS